MLKNDWIEEKIRELIGYNNFLDSSKAVAKWLSEQYNETIRPYETYNVMKDQMGMKYRKIVKAT